MSGSSLSDTTRPGRRLTPLLRSFLADEPEKMKLAFLSSIRYCAVSKSVGTF
jgi:hypothetical protein